MSTMALTRLQKNDQLRLATSYASRGSTSTGHESSETWQRPETSVLGRTRYRLLCEIADTCCRSSDGCAAHQWRQRRLPREHVAADDAPVVRRPQQTGVAAADRSAEGEVVILSAYQDAFPTIKVQQTPSRSSSKTRVPSCMSSY
jgi:hypothetical protein